MIRHEMKLVGCLVGFETLKSLDITDGWLILGFMRGWLKRWSEKINWENRERIRKKMRWCVRSLEGGLVALFILWGCNITGTDGDSSHNLQYVGCLSLRMALKVLKHKIDNFFKTRFNLCINVKTTCKIMWFTDLQNSILYLHRCIPS